jgi:hypothetical protein
MTSLVANNTHGLAYNDPQYTVHQLSSETLSNVANNIALVTAPYPFVAYSGSVTALAAGSIDVSFFHVNAVSGVITTLGSAIANVGNTGNVVFSNTSGGILCGAGDVVYANSNSAVQSVAAIEYSVAVSASVTS